MRVVSNANLVIFMCVTVDWEPNEIRSNSIAGIVLEIPLLAGTERLPHTP